MVDEAKVREALDEAKKLADRSGYSSAIHIVKLLREALGEAPSY